MPEPPSWNGLLRCCAAPIFVVGGSRAGTTWFQSLVAAHPEVVSRPETKLFQHALMPSLRLTFRERYPQSEPWVPRKIDAAALETVFEHLGAVGFIDLKGETRALLRWLASAGDLDPCTLLNVIMYEDEAGLSEGQRVWVEKTPRHVFALDAIWRCFPTARVICVFRDVGDQAYSAFRTFGLPVLEGLRDGTRSYAAWESYLAEHPERRSLSLRVDYERLRSDLEGTMKRVWSFLGLADPGLDGAELEERSRRSFGSVYEETAMKGWQRQMRSGVADGRWEARERVAVRRLAAVFYRPALVYTSGPRDDGPPGALWGPALRHGALYLVFLCRQGVKWVLVRGGRLLRLAR